MKARIAILHYTAPSVIGGAEAVIQQHIRLLQTAGYQVTMIAGRGRHRASTGVNNYSFVRVPALSVTHPLQQRVEAELTRGVVSDDFYRLRNTVRDQLAPLLGRHDVILVHNAFTLHFNQALTAALAELACGPLYNRIVAWTHDIAVVNPLYRAELHPGYPWDLLRRPQPGVCYVCISWERRRQLEQVWIESSPSTSQSFETILVIPNGIDISAVLRLSATTKDIVDRFGILDRDLVLLLPVRITRRKNIETGIAVTRALKDRGIDVLFLVTGPQASHHPGRSQSYLNELQAYARDLGVEKEVILLGDQLGQRISDRVVSELYALSDVLFFPSQSEGFGLPLLEAGALRVPAVVANLPVFRELAGDGATYFALDATPDRIAEKVLATVAAGPARLYRHTLREYRWERIFAEYIVPLIERLSVHHGSSIIR